MYTVCAIAFYAKRNAFQVGKINRESCNKFASVLRLTYLETSKMNLLELHVAVAHAYSPPSEHRGGSSSRYELIMDSFLSTFLSFCPLFVPLCMWEELVVCLWTEIIHGRSARWGRWGICPTIFWRWICTKLCNGPVIFHFIVLHWNTAWRNEVHFIFFRNHHTHGQALLTLHIHTEGVRQSNTNEIDCFKENDFPVIPAAPYANIRRML